MHECRTISLPPFALLWTSQSIFIGLLPDPSTSSSVTQCFAYVFIASDSDQVLPWILKWMTGLLPLTHCWSLVWLTKDLLAAIFLFMYL